VKFQVLAVAVSDKIEMDLGVQPIDALMEAAEMRNHDLVAAQGKGFLTHKQVAKARRGRRLSLKIQMWVLVAWNAARGEERDLEELFSYRGR
jgi:hypothetical protein